MDQNFGEMPKFKSAEDEISFLKEHIARREEELKSSGIEKKKEEITREALNAYKSMPAENILHKDLALEEKEVGAIALHLSPEPHDHKMEELFGMLLDKGLKNVLSVLEKLNNPHLDDDFHRFLVQYLMSAGTVPDLKMNERMFKGVNMALFEISLPPPLEEEKRSLKEIISSMEHFYAGMMSVANNFYNTEENYFTIEIALSGTKDDVVIYAAVPRTKADLFQKQVLGFYADATIREVTDDYNIFSDGGETSGAVGYLSLPEALPIKTYDEMENDPMNSILNVFSKMKREGEGAAIQFTIVPAGDNFIKRFTQVINDVKSGISLNKANEMHKFTKAFTHAATNLIFGQQDKEKKDEAKERNADIVEKLKKKTESTIAQAGIRIVASAGNRMRSEEILSEIISSFNQFSNAGGNAFAFEPLSNKKLSMMLHDFSYRVLDDDTLMPLNFRELSSIFHFPVGVSSQPLLKEAKSGIAPAPMEMDPAGILLGVNSFRGRDTEVHLAREDRMRHFYVVGQTGTGKTNIMLNMITQDIANGDGCCYIDPHGTDIQTILSRIPKERLDDVIYFDPAYTARPMGLNMLEFDQRYPEQKTFVVNELMGIFNKLFDMKTSGGPMFEQYFKNSAFLIMDDPDSGCTLLEITRVLADKEFRQMKLERCKNPIIKQFWIAAEQTTGDQSLANFVPYISSKFDNFISNDIMRPVVLQEKSAFNFRKIMDEKKILLVNLSKGRLGEINANLIGLVLVGKIQMAAFSRVDMFGQKMNDFYLYIDEFQNVTTDSIASILSEARKYRLSLNIAHQYISQLEDNIKNAVFGNVGSMAIFRVSSEDAEFLEKKLLPTFKAQDITRLENYNAYMSMLVRGTPTKPFNMVTLSPETGHPEMVEKIKELSYLKFGRDRAEIENEILEKYKKQ